MGPPRSLRKNGLPGSVGSPTSCLKATNRERQFANPWGRATSLHRPPLPRRTTRLAAPGSRNKSPSTSAQHSDTRRPEPSKSSIMTALRTGRRRRAASPRRRSASREARSVRTWSGRRNLSGVTIQFAARVLRPAAAKKARSRSPRVEGDRPACAMVGLGRICPVRMSHTPLIRRGGPPMTEFLGGRREKSCRTRPHRNFAGAGCVS
jgi:hypothetical protein